MHIEGAADIAASGLGIIIEQGFGGDDQPGAAIAAGRPDPPRNLRQRKEPARLRGEQALSAAEPREAWTAAGAGPPIVASGSAWRPTDPPGVRAVLRRRFPGIGADSLASLGNDQIDHGPQRLFLGVALQPAEPIEVELAVGAAAVPYRLWSEYGLTHLAAAYSEMTVSTWRSSRSQPISRASSATSSTSRAACSSMSTRPSAPEMSPRNASTP